MYSSLPNTVFAQQNPRYSCKSERYNLEQSYRLGWEIKCRRASCSRECNFNWSVKHERCLARHLQELPTEYKRYRGNLTLDYGKTPADHVQVRRAFLQTLTRWKKRHGYELEVHAMLHCTAVDQAHWDTVAYSNAPKTVLRAAIAEAWTRAGGFHQSLIPMEDDETVAHAKYLAKARQVDRGELRRRFVPAGVLNLHWSTGGFWQGTTVETIWKELISEWYGERSSNKKDTTLASTSSLDITSLSNKKDTTLEPTSPLVFDPSNLLTYSLDPLVNDPVKAAFRAEIKSRLDDLDNGAGLKSRLAQTIPRSPLNAVGVSVLAEQWGVRPDQVLSCLKEIPDIKVMNGELIDGKHQYGLVWRELPTV